MTLNHHRPPARRRPTCRATRLRPRRPRDNRPVGRAGTAARPRRRGSEHSLTDRLTMFCVGAGCTGIPSILFVELVHPTSAGIAAIGTIAAAAFGAAGGIRGLRGLRRRR